MSNPFRVDTATAPPETTILDVFDEISTHPTVIQRRGVWGAIDQAVARTAIFNLVTGAFAVGNRFQGGLWYQATSAAASVRSRFFQDLQWPIGQDMSLAPVPFRYPRRYILEAVLERDAALVADVTLSFQFSFVGVPLLDGGVGAAPAGFAIASNSLVNGGNWTVQRRNANAGAPPQPLQLSVDTGIPGTTQILAQIVYEDTSAPRLFAMVNGTQFGLSSGLANIPTLPTTNDWFFGFVQGDTLAGGAGQVDRVRGTRVKIQELTGYGA